MSRSFNRFVQLLTVVVAFAMVLSLPLLGSPALATLITDQESTPGQISGANPVVGSVGGPSSQAEAGSPETPTETDELPAHAATDGLPETMDETPSTTMVLSGADNVLAARQNYAHTGRLPGGLTWRLGESRASLSLAQDLIARINESTSRRPAALYAAEMALADRERQATAGHLLNKRVHLVQRKQAELRLSRAILTNFSDSSKSGRTAILDVAELGIASHQQDAGQMTMDGMVHGGRTANASRSFADRGVENVQTARRILGAAIAVSNEPPIEQGAALEQETRGLQEGRPTADEPMDSATQQPTHAAPSKAMFALLGRHNVTPTTEEEAQIRAFDDLSEPTRAALTDYLDAYLAYEAATQAALADVNWTRLHSARNGGGLHTWSETIAENETARESMRAAGVDVSRVVAARSQLIEASVSLHSSLDSVNGSGNSNHVEVDGVVSIDLRETDTTYSTNYAVQVDAGGDDSYRNNAGGNNLDDQSCDDFVTGDRVNAAALVDFGGNDVYANPRGCGQRGGAQLGSGFLLDVSGDDTYTDTQVALEEGQTRTNETKGRLGTNGGGAYGGFGFLMDVSGSDSYFAGGRGTNGGAYQQSTGFLLDSGGDDRYNATGDLGLNGGASTDGIGVLVDGDGNDTYIAGSRGTNGGGDYDGEAFLIDLAGNDTYGAGGSGANGGGLKGGAGFLLDNSGSDTYDGGGAGANGGSHRGGIGTLVDVTGTDEYRGSSSGVNGGGGRVRDAYVTTSAGFLFDGGGSDIYRATGSGTNGGGTAHFGSGFLVDAGQRDDTYIGGGDGANGGSGRMSSAGGFLLDGGGNDTYAAGGLGVNGGGRSGAGGFLVDAGNGNDTYNATGLAATNGGGKGSMGFLLDMGGSDTYTTRGHGTNGGASDGGLGFLLDAGSSDDTYTAEGQGTNGGGDSGVGFLFDAGGNDTYSAGSVGTNGGSTYGSEGFLVDAGGTDSYNASRPAANGGSYGGVGLLLDAGTSDDTYAAGGGSTAGQKAAIGATNGGANGLGSGVLLDTGGNETYSARFIGTNGGAVVGGSGLLIDGAGNDTYTAAFNGTNGGAKSAVALLYDAGGHDTYEDADGGTGTDRSVVPKGETGGQVDGDLGGTGTPIDSPDSEGLLDIVTPVFKAVVDLLTGLFDTLTSAGLLFPAGGA